MITTNKPSHITHTEVEREDGCEWSFYKILLEDDLMLMFDLI